ncbi:MAG TPA: WYL domain-containing protein [Bacillales bacterium]|nr:WYL domain-containing protein [Bacillales bacterium]
MAELPTRQRVLTILDLLRTKTDEEHEWSLKNLKDELKRIYGADYEVKDDVLRKDIRSLDETVLPIVSNNGPRGKKLYSHQERLFELSELRMLMDAVVSARFMTKKEAKNLIRKIKNLTSEGQARKLPHEYYLEGTVKSESAYLRYDIDSLHRAISETKKIQFQYGTYNVDKVFELHRGGEFYVVKPYALIWNNNFYYVIGEFEKYGEIRHYRVDRMRNVKVRKESFKRESFNIGEYVNKSFNMYAGNEEEWIKLKIDNGLLNVMIDRFGIDVDIKRADEKTFYLKTKAAISDGLIHWLLTWGGDARVLAPDHLIQSMQEESERLYKVYHS